MAEVHLTGHEMQLLGLISDRSARLPRAPRISLVGLIWKIDITGSQNRLKTFTSGRFLLTKSHDESLHGRLTFRPLRKIRPTNRRDRRAKGVIGKLHFRSNRSANVNHICIWGVSDRGRDGVRTKFGFWYALEPFSLNKSWFHHGIFL